MPRLQLEAATGLPAPEDTEFVPPAATRPMPLRPEAVERMVFAVASAEPVAAAAVSPVLPARALDLSLSGTEYGRPLAATSPMPLRPEAVERMVFTAASVHPVAVAAVAPLLPARAWDLSLSGAEYGRPLAATSPMPLRPEAVERMVFAVASAEPVAAAGAAVTTRALDLSVSKAEYGWPLAAAGPMPLQPEAVERMVFAVASAEPVAAAAHVIALVLPTRVLEVPLSRAEYGRALQVSTAPVAPAYASPAAIPVTASAAPLRLPDLQIAAAEPHLAPVPVPQTRDRWAATPATESVYASPAAGSADAASTGPSLPKFQIEPFELSLEPEPAYTPRTRWTPAPGVEPVHTLPAPEAAESGTVQPWLPKFQVVPFEPGLASTAEPNVRERWTPASTREPVPTSPAPSAATPAAAQPRLPKFQLPPADVCLEPVPVPQACNEWMPNLSAEPVCIEVLAISVPESCGVPEFRLPGIHIFSVAEPWMPVSLRPKPPLVAEPVSMRVWAKAATAALPIYAELPEPHVPDGRELLAADAGRNWRLRRARCPRFDGRAGGAHGISVVPTGASAGQRRPDSPDAGFGTPAEEGRSAPRGSC